jgi:hypothetical protein
MATGQTFVTWFRRLSSPRKWTALAEFKNKKDAEKDLEHYLALRQPQEGEISTPHKTFTGVALPKGEHPNTFKVAPQEGDSTCGA